MSWGSDCAAVISAYTTAVTIGELPVYSSVDEANGTDGANISCHENDNAAYPTFDGAENCSLAPLANGLM